MKLTERQLHSLIKEHLQKLLVKEDISSTDDMFEELANIVDQDFMNIANKAESFMKQNGYSVNHILGGLYNKLFDVLNDWFDEIVD